MEYLIIICFYVIFCLSLCLFIDRIKLILKDRKKRKNSKEVINYEDF